MEIKVKIEAPGLEKSIMALAKVMSRFGSDEVAIEDAKTGKVTKSVEEALKTNEAKKAKKAKKATEIEKTEKKEEDKPEISLEFVRTKMVELSRTGKQKEMKKIITSFGVNKLSDIPNEKYPQLLEKVEALL